MRLSRHFFVSFAVFLIPIAHVVDVRGQDRASDEHILPWVVTGGGYESTLLLRLDTFWAAEFATCAATGPLVDRGLLDRTFELHENATSFVDIRQPVTGDLVTGYVHLQCDDDDVYVQVVYTYKIDQIVFAEATVMSSREGFREAHLNVDVVDSSTEWFGLAIANVAGFEQDYCVEFRNQSGELYGNYVTSVDARNAVGINLTNLVDDNDEPVFDAGFRGAIRVFTIRQNRSFINFDPCGTQTEWTLHYDAPNFGVIGLHGNGSTFSTVPVMRY